MEHTGHDHHHKSTETEISKGIFKLALSATFHCLIGCGIGEVLGMIVSTHFGFNNTVSIIISIVAGFTGGFLLGIIPLKKAGFTLIKAFKIVFWGEGLSIVVMEAFELLAEVSIPGVMNAHLNEWIFWFGMGAALTVGFIAAFPVNYFMIRAGKGHRHE